MSSICHQWYTSKGTELERTTSFLIRMLGNNLALGLEILVIRMNWKFRIMNRPHREARHAAGRRRGQAKSNLVRISLNLWLIPWNFSLLELISDGELDVP
jgi:hypothetical protein